MKFKKLSFVLSFISLASLTSCFFFVPTDKNTETTSSSTTKTFANYKTPTYTSDYSKDNLNKDMLGRGFGYRYMPSVGDSKLLVIPIQTTDYTFSSSDLNLIEKGFFGEASETGWQSVASFYAESSYGKLKITGEVSPVINLGKTSTELETIAKSYSNNNKNYTDAILDAALEAIATKTDIDLTQYDTDGDGYIDAVWMVYSPKYNRNSDFYWAYTTWTSSSNTYSGKKACCYAWASVSFLTQKNYSTLLDKTNIADSHTFVHETGHMLGLDDYYSYDYSYSSSNRNGNTDTPVGGVDMMDFNIGDHDSYSKYVLGWSSPTVITEEYLEANNYQLTLRSMTETGESFLLPCYKDGNIEYNGTPFDEYLLIEYYTPTGLNKKDSEEKYSNNLSTYTKCGVLVYHIDATVGKLVATSSGSISWDGYAYDKLPAYSSDLGRKYAYFPIYSNTYSYSYNQDITDDGLSYYRGRLISLLPSTGKRINGSKTGYSGNSSLYTKGKTFGRNGVYSDFCFDDGSKPQFSFTVKTTSDSDCVIEFGAN